MSHSPRPFSGRAALVALTGLYFIFVVYGSLVPFEFRAHSLVDAWQTLSAVRWLALSFTQRADWMANALLYIPLAWLLAASVSPRTPSAAARVAVAVLVYATCAIVAVAIEFTQVFFPNRTVSLNDIVAEWAGIAFGTALWALMNDKAARLVAGARGNRSDAFRALLVIYLIAYLLLSLFPYDFVLSSRDIALKLASGTYGSWFAPGACSQIFRCTTKLTAEALAAAPVGILLGLARSRARSGGTMKVLACGGLVGVAIEAAQFLIASGISQGVSVATRAAGILLAYTATRSLESKGISNIRPKLRALVLIAAVPYLFVLAHADGLTGGTWLTWPEALARLAEVRFVPFYYYYYTSETRAMFSLLAVAALYGPVGVAAWAWAAARDRNDQVSIWLVALSGAAMCAALEIAKLFVPGKHADPTDILIAATGAALGFAALHIPSASRRPKVSAHHAAVRSEREMQNAPPPAPISAARAHASLGSMLLAAVLAIGAIGIAANHALGAGWAVLALVAYTAMLIRHASAWLVLLPALLPLLDLAPWSGRFFVTEFDLLVLATAAIGYARNMGGASVRIGALPALLLTALVCSYIASTISGLLPLQPLDINALSSYHSHYNALRALKGVLWALLLGPLVLRSWGRGVNVPQLFSIGMVLGLAGVTAYVFWERLTFPGLFNFAHEYRVTGPFPEMHTGGAYIEAYLLMALPFCGYTMLAIRSVLLRVFAIGLFAGGCHAVLVTYSRGAYLALALVLLVVCVTALIHVARRRAHRFAVLLVPLLLLSAGLVAVPIVEGSFIQARFSQVTRDLGVRERHWHDALRLMDKGWATSLLGMGLGRYPESYFWKNSEGVRPATYRYEREGGNVFLRLGSGDSLYMDQVMSLKSHESYKLSVDLRSTTPEAALTAAICQKSMLDSFNCIWRTIKVASTDGAWHRHELDFNAGSVPSGPWFARRPVKLSVFNQRGSVDVDNVAVTDVTATNLVANGDFEGGNDYWFFATDNHLPWHIKNIWLHLYFEQGWLGLLASGALIALAIVRLTGKVSDGDPFSGAILSALLGCLAVGTFDSVIDAPRFATLFWLLLLLALPGLGRLRPETAAMMVRTRLRQSDTPRRMFCASRRA
jgi:VanZ family protein